MNFYRLLGVMLAMPTLLSAGCAGGTSESDEGSFPMLADSLVIDDRTIYLLGEMNHFKASSAHALLRSGDRYCAKSGLRADLAPYRFKFADDAWSQGTNFGFAAPPGTLYLDSTPVELNGSSRFEELRFYPQEDGIYRFCMFRRGDSYFAEVKLSDANALAYLEALLGYGQPH